MKLSKLIIGESGKPTFRIEPPPRFEPLPRGSVVPQRSYESLRLMVNADETNRANAAEWMRIFHDRAEEYAAISREYATAEELFRRALSEVEL